MKNKSALVIGANGMVGTALMRALAKNKKPEHNFISRTQNYYDETIDMSSSQATIFGISLPHFVHW